MVYSQIWLNLLVDDCQLGYTSQNRKKGIPWYKCKICEKFEYLNISKSFNLLSVNYIIIIIIILERIVCN